MWTQTFNFRSKKQKNLEDESHELSIDLVLVALAETKEEINIHIPSFLNFWSLLNFFDTEEINEGANSNFF